MMGLPRGPRRMGLAGVVALVAFAAAPLVTTRGDLLNTLVVLFISVALAQSWNVLGGLAGQVNLGHAAFFGAGALTARLLWFAEMPIALAVAAGSLAAIALGLVIGLPAFRKPNESRIEILLRHYQQVVTVNEQRKNVVLGRSEECDIVVRTGLASRQHARIELSFGKFMLADHSVNGTYVRLGDGQVIQLAHEAIALHGAGAISLGEAFSESPTELIEFIVQ